jgi:hypothetical protein
LSHDDTVSILLQETEAGFWDPQLTDSFITLCNDPTYMIAPCDRAPSP